ncbi:hypothetical protein ACERII_05495 [Evansella sp. AB-rgal1]|uniref:hypothetical protein n=1 Tax=Evansella sp. AB-rgal1 TaxID=3242696 RepID=UPI00359F12D8
MKTKHLSSENSEDAITWNVFRSLQQLDPTIWLPEMFTTSFNMPFPYSTQHTNIKLWKLLQPPQERKNMEGPTEIDILIETDEFVWIMEAKYKSDISMETKHDKDRNQIIRNIDVGSIYSNKKDFYFTLLALQPEVAPKGYSTIKEYKEDGSKIDVQLDPRKVSNLKGIEFLTWSEIIDVLASFETKTPDEYEKYVAERARRWLEGKI